MKSLRSLLSAAALAAVPAVALLASTPALADHRDNDEQSDRWGQQRFYRDQAAPQIVDVTPDQGDRVDDRRRTRISARFEDQGTGVQAAWLRVDGRDVTGWSRFDGEQIRYRDDLAPGRHVAEVIVRDRAGNVNRRAWSFVVVDRDRHDRGYEGRYGYYGQPQPQPYRW
ncbi:MAG TPA: hypothetical protein VF522_15145 [Ramlibacter sp.]|uniref:hypothetical protein n=1 Tax=Ramlibacter sp. TaxID=1917967 RepID=UPI002ED65DA2